MNTEKLNRDLDNLTPLDARNSLLIDPNRHVNNPSYDHDIKHPLVKQDSFMNDPANPYSNAHTARPYVQHRQLSSVDSSENLVEGAAPLGGRAASPPRHPGFPNGGGYGNNGYGGNGYRGMAY